MSNSFRILRFLSAWTLIYSTYALAKNGAVSQPIAATWEVYEDRYGDLFKSENQLMAKMTDNRGDGFEELYGTRNVRVVLHGIYYRGGANNYYHRSEPRNNMNPLPSDGLNNLCREGFQKAIYFYEPNFSPKKVICESRLGGKNALNYTQISALEDTPGIMAVLRDIYTCIFSGNGCPIYGHCWNGWHASGLVAATVLRQFCDFTPEQAVKYWIDGADTIENSSFPSIKRKITDFTPFAEFEISEKIKSEICPQNTY